jgi:hypothetical protein
MTMKKTKKTKKTKKATSKALSKAVALLHKIRNIFWQSRNGWIWTLSVACVS